MTNANSQIKVRMYRQGLGDCFLVTLPTVGGKPFYLMIDCGVILGTSNAVAMMSNVVQNIIDTTGGNIDLLIATHEHWDHLSGFVQAKDLFSKLDVSEVWVAWTEDPNDELANSLRNEGQALRMALSQAAMRMQMSGGADGAAEVTGLLEFFGAAGSGTTGDALKVVKSLPKQKPLRFCLPSDAPVDLPGAGARLYILGPPHDLKQIKRFNPSKSAPETYGMAAFGAVASALMPRATEDDLSAPFDVSAQIPIEAAKQMPFFQAHYWGEDADGEEKDQSWRNIDASWLDSSTSLALQLDSATNNTSLVLAIELENGEVLLFAADAQVGNWLSWQDLKWTVEGKDVTGPDLLSRAIFYKVGHHGSHNATLKEKGLEMMTNLEIAMIPVNHEMALKKRWGNMPLPDLLTRLNAKTGNRVLRIDADPPPELAKLVDQSNPLYYEIDLPLA
jgi:beta-lactamase superfamily II metal-dependent hydrolase